MFDFDLTPIIVCAAVACITAIGIFALIHPED